MNAPTATLIRKYGIATIPDFTEARYRQLKREWNGLPARQRGALRRRMRRVVAELAERRKAARRAG